MTATNPELFGDGPVDAPKPTQTDRFARRLSDKLAGDPSTVNIADLFAGQPGCPPEVRLLALLADPTSNHILEQNELHLGDNPEEAKQRLGRFLVAEHQQENEGS